MTNLNPNPNNINNKSLANADGDLNRPNSVEVSHNHSVKKTPIKLKPPAITFSAAIYTVVTNNDIYKNKQNAIAPTKMPQED
jgi:hypothetical protein